MRRLLLLFCATAMAQQLSFEVASIKPATPLKPGESRGTKFNPGGIDFYTTLRYCIGMAYDVRDYQIAAPAWLKDTTFEIVAKAPAGTTREQFPEMMKSLLADRFRLQTHEETTDFDGFGLKIVKDGPKLTPAVAKRDASGRFFTSLARMSPGGNGTVEYHANTMEMLARNLTNLIGRPVVNDTQVEGRYEFSLEYNRYDSANGSSFRVVGGAPAPDVEPGISVFSSIQKYGLKLEPRKVPGKLIVVDRIEKTPTEN